LRGVTYFGMKLNAMDLTSPITHRRHRSRGALAVHLKALGWSDYDITVAHPDVLPGTQSLKKWGIREDFHISFSVLTLFCPFDLAPEMGTDQLHSVANAQNRNPQLKDGRITF